MPPPRGSAPAADPRWLLDELTAARVLDADQAARVLGEFQAAGASADAAGLADFLVGAGLLTPYQAEQALVGEARRLAVGPYLLLEPLGTGSFGQGFRAVHRSTRARYAVKLLPLRSMWNVLRAKRQVRAFAELPPHPAVVPFVDIDTSGAVHYLAWPFVEGDPFDRLVRRVGPLTPVHAARFAAEVADGLAACHRRDITHGLLKPSNLLLGPDRKAHILDLGIGAILSENIADSESLLDTISTANTALGAIDCAAPETFADPTDRTPAGDAYSLGCVLYFVLTGSYPFPDGNVVEKIIAHQTREPTPIQSRNRRVPDALAEVVGRLMRKDPADRPDMAAVRDALLRAVPEAREAADLPAPEAEAAVARPQVARPTPKISGDPTPLMIEPEEGAGGTVDFNATPEDDTDEDLVLSAAPPAAPEFRPPVSELPVRRAVEVPPPPPVRPSFWQRLVQALFPWVPVRDSVQFSVFGPTALAPGQTTRLHVFAHPPAAFASVRTLSRAFLPDTELLAAGHSGKLIHRGGEVGLYLTVANAGVARPLVVFPWGGQTKPRTFDVYVPWENPAGPSPAELIVGLDGVEVARIPFDVLVRPRSG